MRKQNIGIFGKTFLMTFAIFFIILAIAMFFFFKEYIHVYKDNVKNTMITSAHLLANITTEFDNTENEEKFINNYWQEFSRKNSSIYFSITNKDAKKIGLYPNEPSFKNYSTKHPNKVITANFKLNSGYTYNINFYIKTSTAILECLENMPLLWALLLIIGFISAYFSAHYIANPIELLTNEAERLKNINESPGMVTRSDEIGMLQESIYDLHLTLRNTINDLETENAHISKLESTQRYFFAAASQEFKLPIATIVALLEQLENCVGDNWEAKNKINDCIGRITTLDKLIAEIVDIVKYNDNSKEIPVSNINIKESVSSAINECIPIIEKKNLRLYINVDDSVNILTNVSMFTRVIINVVSNAIQHADDNKSISIWTEQDNKFATLYVFNECSPIPDELIKKLFEPFYRRGDVEINHSMHTGLGLYIVQELLNRMNIAFDMKNREQGICFSIKFKLNKQSNN